VQNASKCKRGSRSPLKTGGSTGTFGIFLAASTDEGKTGKRPTRCGRPMETFGKTSGEGREGDKRQVGKQG